jgi:hypothetical protein
MSVEMQKEPTFAKGKTFKQPSNFTTFGGAEAIEAAFPKINEEKKSNKVLQYVVLPTVGEADKDWREPS